VCPGTLSYLLICTVTRLNDVRDEQVPHKNRLDTTLADVMSLMSLFFLTIGKTRECPATYCQIATIRVCLSFHFARV